MVVVLSVVAIVAVVVVVAGLSVVGVAVMVIVDDVFEWSCDQWTKKKTKKRGCKLTKLYLCIVVVLQVLQINKESNGNIADQ